MKPSLPRVNESLYSPFTLSVSTDRHSRRSPQLYQVVTHKSLVSRYQKLKTTFAMSEIGSDSSRVRCHTETQFENMEENILIDILTRLPAKTIGACKCVSKNWLSLITEPSFAKFHLSRSLKNPKYIICPYPEDKDKIINLVSVMEGDGSISHTMLLPGPEGFYSSEITSFLNGLICSVHEVEEREVNIHILNPITQETLLLPQGSPYFKFKEVGMLFDSESQHYKVFRFFLDLDELENVQRRCEVYSSDSETWEMVFENAEWINYTDFFSWPNSCVSVASTLYSLALSDQELIPSAHIISIDMNYNVSRIDLPTSLRGFIFLIEMESCLTFVWVEHDIDGDDRKPYLKVWKFKDCEWYLTVSCVLDIDVWEVYSVSTVASIDQSILIIFDRYSGLPCFCIFHLVDRTTRTLDLGDTFKDCCPAVYPFAESLLKCNLK